jgi:hypothetical protein
MTVANTEDRPVFDDEEDRGLFVAPNEAADDKTREKKV